jgi:hypothetical protein
MIKDDIIHMARQAGFAVGLGSGVLHKLQAFADLVADAEAKRIHNEGMVTVGHMREQIAAEREECAKVCDSWSLRDSLAAEMAEEIRARGQQ